MPDVVLDGCRPKPLASYLKAIGVLRILSEQQDSKAKGFWRGESFVINTSLTLDNLSHFFCNDYTPTPIVSPWNGGSGFYAGDATDGMDAILQSSHRRFAQYRDVILNVKSWPEISPFQTIRAVLDALNSELAKLSNTGRAEAVGLLNAVEGTASAVSAAIGKDVLDLPIEEAEQAVTGKNIPGFDGRKWWQAIKKARTKATALKRSEGKENILPVCRSRLPEPCVEWLDAVCAIQNDGRRNLNPLLGTGGNEGRFEFSNNFMQRVAELFINGDSAKIVELFGAAVSNGSISGLINASIGQYDPGRAGGYNQGMEIETKNFKINPWDFVLALEGSLVMASAIVRRNPTEDRAWLTVPFSVNFSPVGFSSSAFNEAGRKELWAPIWRKPASYAEVKQLFGEGRACIGKRPAENGVEFSRAVGTLGVDRGIESFERYAFLMRRGKSYVALPAGRIKALYKPKLEILNELDPITKTINGFLRGFKSVPASFGSARQNIEESVFACSQDPSPFNFSKLVRFLGKFEQQIATRDRTKEPALSRPLSGLSPKWIDYCDDGGTEVRIAAALASIRSSGSVGPLRSNMAEIDPGKPWRWAIGNGDRHWFGNDLSKRLSGVLSRRVMDATRRSAKKFPAEGSLSISCQDVMPFLWGLADDNKIEELLWGFNLIDWRKAIPPELLQRWKMPVSGEPIARSYSVLKLLHSPCKTQDIEVRTEPRIISLLIANRIEEACRLAVQRLHASRLSPHMIAYEKDVDNDRLIAAMLIPIRDQRRIESLVLKEKP